MKHLFIFSPGIWLGEGNVSFNYSPNQLKCYIRWQIEPIVTETGKILCHQKVQIAGLKEVTESKVTINPKDEYSFAMSVENESLGLILGSGLIENKVIEWSISNSDNYQGLERYTQIDVDHYSVFAEYQSQGYCTSVTGYIKKAYSF